MAPDQKGVFMVEGNFKDLKEIQDEELARLEAELAKYFETGCQEEAAGEDGGLSDVASNEGSSKPEKSRGAHNRELGMRGEEAACRYLIRRGYEILDRNWKCFAGEADIVACDEDGALVFVEVKTRTDATKGFPSEAVGPKKRAKYEKIALAYLADYDVVDIVVRFDVISIMVLTPERAMIRHHIGAFSTVS